MVAADVFAEKAAVGSVLIWIARRAGFPVVKTQVETLPISGRATFPAFFFAILAGKRACALHYPTLTARILCGRGTTNPRPPRYMAGGITTSASRLPFHDPANIIWNNSRCTFPRLRRVRVAFN